MRKVITAVASGRPGHTRGTMPGKLVHTAFHSKELRNVLELSHLTSRPVFSGSLQIVGRGEEQGGGG